MLNNLFINPVENRLRAGWRLLVQALILLVLTTAFNVAFGVIIAVVAASTGQNAADPRVLMALMQTPLGQIFSSTATLVAIVAGSLVAARWVDRHPFGGFGFHFSPSWWADFAFGLLLGALLMAFIFAVELASGWITVSGTMQSQRANAGFWGGIAVSVVTFICVGIYEELFSRGYLLRNLAEGLNLRFIGPKGALLIAYLVSSSIFGALHAGNPNATLISTLNLIIAGLFLGLGFILTGELAISIGLHMTWNFFQGNVFGFPVSGMNTGASFIGIQQAGPALWTGGPFGPEAGLIGLVAILLGSLLIAAWVRMRYGKLSLAKTLALYRPAAPITSGADTAAAVPSTAAE